MLTVRRHKNEISSLADLLAAYNLPISPNKQGESTQQYM